MPLNNVFSRDNRGLPHFIDEATANLDKDSVEQMKKIIKDELEEYTVILISHTDDMVDVVNRVCSIHEL